MTRLSKVAFLVKYNDASTGLYKAGQTEGIDSSDHRSLTQDLEDSVLWLEDVGDGPWKVDRVTVKTAAPLPANTLTTVSGIQTLTANSNGALTVDGISVAINDSVLVSEQSTSFHNGVYEVTQLGTIFTPWILTLREDSRSADQIAYAIYEVLEGVTNEDTLWKQIYNETGSSISNVAYEEFATGGATDPEVQGVISSADVLTGFAGAVTLLAAAGAGIANVPTEIVLWIDYNSVPYATNVVCDVQVGGISVTGGGVYGLLDRSSDGGVCYVVSIQELQINADITFVVLTGNPTGGDSDINYKIKYKIITI